MGLGQSMLASLLLQALGLEDSHILTVELLLYGTITVANILRLPTVLWLPCQHLPHAQGVWPHVARVPERHILGCAHRARQLGHRRGLCKTNHVMAIYPEIAIVSNTSNVPDNDVGIIQAYMLRVEPTSVHCTELLQCTASDGKHKSSQTSMSSREPLCRQWAHLLLPCGLLCSSNS